MNATAEKLYPAGLGIVVGAAVGFAAFKSGDVKFFPSDADILGSSISLAAIFAGFLATAKSMLISIDTPTMQELKKTRFYSLLLDYLASAIWAALILCVFCLAGYFVKDREKLWWFAGLWSALAVFSLATWFRVTQIFLQLMKLR